MNSASRAAIFPCEDSGDLLDFGPLLATQGGLALIKAPIVPDSIGGRCAIVEGFVESMIVASKSGLPSRVAARTPQELPYNSKCAMPLFNSSAGLAPIVDGGDTTLLRARPGT